MEVLIISADRRLKRIIDRGVEENWSTRGKREPLKRMIYDYSQWLWRATRDRLLVIVQSYLIEFDKCLSYLDRQLDEQLERSTSARQRWRIAPIVKNRRGHNNVLSRTLAGIDLMRRSASAGVVGTRDVKNRVGVTGSGKS